MALIDIDRRMKLIGIVLLVLIVGWWIYLFSTKDERRMETSDDTSKHEIVASDNPNAPEIEFPEQARSDNEEVNDFVIAFAKDLLSGDYKSYRAKVTNRREPINQKAFNEGFGKIKNIQIKEIIKTDDVEILKEKKMEDAELPVYRVMIHVDFRNKNTRDVELWIFKEQGHWVSSH